jgi:hypothetical protein
MFTNKKLQNKDTITLNSSPHSPCFCSYCTTAFRGLSLQRKKLFEHFKTDEQENRY